MLAQGLNLEGRLFEIENESHFLYILPLWAQVLLMSHLQDNTKPGLQRLTLGKMLELAGGN